MHFRCYLNGYIVVLMTEQFYSFSYTLPSDTSISSFNVIINLVGGGNELYNNNGVGFPVQDSIMFQSPQSCLNQGKLTIVAAVSTILGIYEIVFPPSMLSPVDHPNYSCSYN
jgi:hypothetical protein